MRAEDLGIEAQPIVAKHLPCRFPIEADTQECPCHFLETIRFQQPFRAEEPRRGPAAEVGEDVVNLGPDLPRLVVALDRDLEAVDASQSTARCGGSLSNMVQVQVYLVERKDASGFNKVYREFFLERSPVRATLVTDLLSEGSGLKSWPQPSCKQLEFATSVPTLH